MYIHPHMHACNGTCVHIYIKIITYICNGEIANTYVSLY